jgi:hypothetical protein
MKILVLAIVLLLSAGVSSAYVQQVFGLIDLEVRKYDPTIEHDKSERSPIEIPEVSQEGHTLCFDASCADNLLQLVQNGEIVYATLIPVEVQMVLLPSNLSGEYELQIIRDNWCFYGDITL